MQRLKTRAQFQAVLAGGTLARTHHFALHRVALDCAGESLFPMVDTWLGAMVPKRWAKRAVTRNAIKRQIYAVSAISPLLPQAHVVRLRATFDRKQFISATSDVLKTAVREELIKLFKRAEEASIHSNLKAVA
ncbi:MAG: ribonuclease P protein component [Betaproteobacteria bacterium]|nr:ribonuclease P protein component [Betaproteobacteria bacterium]MBP6646868.1 ribonuclease P protein component [Burkholderiaceae bacterium]